MIRNLLLTVLTVISFFVADAQVKIGNNPSTINANSILELESTNQGLLPPRIPLSSVSSPSPLTAPVPSGMLVYSSGGTLTDGYYYWNGAKWLNINSNTSRSNYVLVKSAADLPAPSSGIITLSPGTLYEINGSVTLSDMINLNGCNIRGADPLNDKLIYTGGGELFTGATGGIRLLTLTSSSGKIFNINASGSTNLLVQNCYFIGCQEVGTIQGVGGTVFMQNVAYFTNQNGIHFQNCSNVVLNNALWDMSNHNTYERFSGTFNIIQILGGDRLVSSANSATAVNVSAVSTLTAGSIKVVMFTGSGTYVAGTFTPKWEIESTGLNTEKDDVATGNLYMTASATTSFTAANTPVKISGTTNSTELFRMSSSISNRLVYDGAKARRFQVICSLTASPSSNNNVYSFYIAKNGTVIPESKQSVKMTNTSDQQSVTVSCNVLLQPGQYIELFGDNNSSSGHINVHTFNMSAN